MCIAIPMKIAEINREKNTASVVYSGNELEINIRLVNPIIGDYVLVHAGCAIEIVNRETADEISDFLEQIYEE